MQWRWGSGPALHAVPVEVTEGLRNVRSLTWKRTKLPLWQSMMFPSVSSRGSLLLRVTVVARDCGTALTETSADNATTTRIADIVCFEPLLGERTWKSTKVGTWNRTKRKFELSPWQSCQLHGLRTPAPGPSARPMVPDVCTSDQGDTVEEKA
jgi:hypothetical protein